MNKHLSLFLVVFAVLVPSLMLAQQNDQSTLVQQSLVLFKNYQNLIELREVGVQGVSDEKAAEFKALFVSDAAIYDDICPNQVEDTPYKLSNKSVNQYIQDVKRMYPEGINASITKATIAIKDNGTVEFIYEKSTSATTEHQGKRITFQNKDTLQMVVKWVDNKVKIVAITSVGSNITCNPCFYDKQVKTKVKEEEVISIGNPNKLKTSKIVLNAMIGGSFGMASTALGDRDFTKLNYVDVPVTSSDVAYKDASVSSFFDAGARVEILFGKKETRFGLYLGVDYTKINASYTADTLFQSFYSENDAFNRHLTYYNVEEQVSISAIGIPVGLSGVINVSEKLKVYVGAGAKLLVGSGVSSSYNTKADNELVLHYNNAGQPIIDETGTIDQQDWVFTTEAVPSGQDPDAYFARAAELGYPVTIGNEIDGETGKINLGFAVQAQLAAGVRYFISPTVFLQPSIVLGYTGFANKGPDNQPENLATTPYYSLLHYSSKLSALQVGINVSLGFNLIK